MTFLFWSKLPNTLPYLYLGVQTLPPKWDKVHAQKGLGGISRIKNFFLHFPHHTMCISLFHYQTPSFLKAHLMFACPLTHHPPCSRWALFLLEYAKQLSSLSPQSAFDICLKHASLNFKSPGKFGLKQNLLKEKEWVSSIHLLPESTESIGKKYLD